MAEHLRIVGMVDDQPITTIPTHCIRWPCKGAVRPSGGFHKCADCGGSYGPVRAAQ